MSGNSRLAALLAALAVAALAVFAAGCGDSDDGTTGGGGGGGERLTVGSDVPYPPFEEFGKTKSEFKGFDIELVEAIAEKIGREAEFKDTSFDTIFRDLAQGKFETVASATTITEEREESVDFTNPYYLPSAQSIVVKEGNTDIKSDKGPRRHSRRRAAGDDRRGICRRRNRHQGTPHLPAGPGHDPGA